MKKLWELIKPIEKEEIFVNYDDKSFLKLLDKSIQEIKRKKHIKKGWVCDICSETILQSNKKQNTIYFGDKLIPLSMNLCPYCFNILLSSIHNKYYSVEGKVLSNNLSLKKNQMLLLTEK